MCIGRLHLHSLLLHTAQHLYAKQQVLVPLLYVVCSLRALAGVPGFTVQLCCKRGAVASQAGLPGNRLTDTVLRTAGPRGSAPARRPAATPAAPARRPAVTPAARSRSGAPVNWEVTEDEEDFLERQVRPPSHLLCLLTAK